MLFTAVESSDQFYLHVRVNGQVFTSPQRGLGVRDGRVLDFAKLLARRDAVRPKGARDVAVDLPADEAAALRTALGDGPADVAIDLLWEDHSPLGTFHARAARPGAAVELPTLSDPDEGLERVWWAVDELDFEEPC